MREVWKDIEGYEGYYQVSSFGNVKSLQRLRYNSNAVLSERLLKATLNSDKYYCVKLYKNGKKTSYKVHELVANAFVIGKKEKLQINHIDGVKTNNFHLNLEWVTPKENAQHAFENRLNKTKKYFVDNEVLRYLKGKGFTNKQIGNLYNCSRSVIKYYVTKDKGVQNE